MKASFENCPPIDFALEHERHAFARALDSLSSEISETPLSARPILSGERITTSDEDHSIDPSDGRSQLGSVFYADKELAQQAVEMLASGWKGWRALSASERCARIHRTAELMEERRYRLAALITREAGKPWKEADADVIEAIDFCHFYASEMRSLSEPRLTQNVLGERNHLLYRARGLTLVISPWNFPLAIPCGMVVAALVAGNGVIFKPAEQTSLIAAEFTSILLEAGVDPNAIAFLPGRGEEIGPLLVDHPQVDTIVFTGSKSVGLEIARRASIVNDNQQSVKRVVTEMGGKNAIIVDEDADFDEALKGVLYSAFAYAGQKCSACSRLIVVGPAYEPFLERLASAARDYPIGSASDPSTQIGPLIDGEAQSRVRQLCEKADKELKVLFEGKCPESGFFVAPRIYRDVEPTAALWREEAFAPVLACTQADSFEHAIQLTNDSQYALTGAVYSRSPKHIQKACEDLAVGNLYINRGSTGAIVERQPFGGFKLSGMGMKAGCKEYLLQFLNQQCISENTMRRGFSPDLVS